MAGSVYENIHAQYLRACVKEFEALNLTQDTSRLNASVAAESLFFNNRFDLEGVPDAAAIKWTKFIKITRINDMIDAGHGASLHRH